MRRTFLTVIASVTAVVILFLVLRGIASFQSPGAQPLSNSNHPVPAEQPPYKPHVSLVYSSGYLIDLAGLEKLHPFDIHKYKKIHDQLVSEGLIAAEQFHQPDPLDDDLILRAHTPRYLENLKNPLLVSGYLEAPQLAFLPQAMLEERVLKPFRISSGGTILAARLALENGVAITLGGGYHHAMPEAGEGFCLFADILIAIDLLREEKKIRRALVIDVDVHQGNGTAVCLADDEESFTFSMHQGDIYPIPKEKSDWDIELKAGAGDEAFNNILQKALPILFEKAKPDIVFIQAGCDTLAEDPLAELEMTTEGIVRRDALIVQACVDHKTPVVLTLGGGYSPQAWKTQYQSLRQIIEKYGLTETKTEREE